MKTVVLYYLEQKYDDVDFEIVSVNQFPDEATNDDIDYALNIRGHDYYKWETVNQYVFTPTSKTVYARVPEETP